MPEGVQVQNYESKDTCLSFLGAIKSFLEEITTGSRASKRMLDALANGSRPREALIY
jgi:hypothetical protein